MQLRLEQLVAFQHLAILRKAGFVITERSGKQIFYSINYQWLKECRHWPGNWLIQLHVRNDLNNSEAVMVRKNARDREKL